MSARPFKRAIRVAGGTGLGLLACASVGLGAIRESSILGAEVPSAFAVLCVTGIVIVLMLTLTRRLRFEIPSARAQRVSVWMRSAATFIDLEVALALVAATYTLLVLTGGVHSDFYPLLYAVVAFSVTFQARVAVVGTLVAVVALETVVLIRGDSTALNDVVMHLLFVVGAALVHSVFLRGMVASHRRRHRLRLDREVRLQRESARDYRLISVALGADSRAPRSRHEEEEILQAGSVATISSANYHSLSLLHQALDARSTVLLWLNRRGSELRIKEVVSNSDAITEDAAIPLSGVIKAAIRDGKALMLPHTKAGHIGYYEGGFERGAFLGIPVLEGQHLRGLLCVDRNQPFTEKHKILAESAAAQVLHAIRSEQVFGTVERAKYEHERFYQASALLCKALTLEQVQNTAFDAAAAITEFDLGIISLFDPERKRHRVCCIRETENSASIVNLEQVRGHEFRENAGLVSMVVKNKHYLPAAGALRDSSTPVFNKKTSFQCQSLLVLPLLSADEAIGTLTLASKDAGRFGKDTREMLGVICNQVAVSMQNGLMYKKMETMATTDGLTGLTNHRSFQERFREMLERSQRHGHHTAMLLCDVDHFKSVNDTYGHPVGDEVLRQVARVLQEATRKVDISARYGGEEFTVVLEATDLEAALQTAERIREDVGNLVLDSDQGTFQIKMSIGVSSFPDDGGDTATLIERADMSLYHAKESGRNRVVCYRDFDEQRKLCAS